MIATFLIMLIAPGMGIFILYCLISGLFNKHDKSQSNHLPHSIDVQARKEEQRINEWGLDDDWRWRKL